MGRFGRPEPEQPLNYYGLPELGFSEGLDTGNRLQDQIYIESLCFRIGHKPEEGGLGKFEHFRNYVNLMWNNPDLGGLKKFVWNDWSDKMLRKACEWDELGVAGCTSAGKSGPFALWAVANYAMDPTHTKVLVMSTSLKGAKNRIWKDLLEFWSAIPNMPGKLLRATNEIQGLDYQKTGYGQSSGIELMATEKSSEASAMDKLIGIKAPKTGNPGASFEELMLQPEYEDLAGTRDNEALRDLITRLQELSDDRVGRLIVIVDEATGAAEGVLNAIQANLKPGNVGRVQVIFLGNPAGHFDSFAKFCEPAVGWDGVTINDEEWETASGGLCIRFNAEKNPRIVNGDERLFWMPRLKDIEDMALKFGRGSLYFYRMVLGFWHPKGLAAGVYSDADFLSTGAMGRNTTWGFKPPTHHAGFDPSFVLGGDRAVSTFGSLGFTPDGLQILQRDEEITIMADINNLDVPVPYQLVRNWRRECEKRGIPPENAAFDATGGGVSFAAIVQTQWSKSVQAISSGGKATRTEISEKGSDGKKLTAADRFKNRATEIWCAAQAFLRSGQIRGISTELAKEICNRQYDKGGGDGRTLQIESKRIFKSREKHSPDSSDSYFILVEHVKTRHGFKPSEKAAVEPDKPNKVSTWKAFCAKARRITTKRNLK